MSEPGVIKKLDENVINRIAAGEIIQRPVNALKELIENSLDAKSSNIQITVKNGGLKFLQIQDNGTGIRKDDFKIVCERFTTSKLQEFEDLHKISTYGFRGEALASISHIAHLAITSKIKTDVCAYHAEFIDGRLKAPPKPIAGNQGTIITVEDLFYNLTVRKKALRSPTEEYQKIVDVVSKYAIHNSNVGFSLKKSGSTVDIKTLPNSTQIDDIQTIYGSNIARELLEVNIEQSTLKFKAKGYITNVNYSTKKFQFLLFINHRLVDCQSLKKCLDNIYQTYLPKNVHPFVYLSVELDPNNVDVNVHPTKHEVHFLNEEQIVDSIMKAVEAKLLGSNNSRVFYTQAKLPVLMHFDTKEPSKDPIEPIKVVYDKDLVRTDEKLQKLDKFLSVATTKTDPKVVQKKLDVSLDEEVFARHHAEFVKKHNEFEERLNETSDSMEILFTEEPEIKTTDKRLDSEMGIPEKLEKQINKPVLLHKDEHTTSLSKHLIQKITKVETKLTSVLELRKAVETNCQRSLRETFAQHVFVGAISTNQALIQYGTKLLLCNTQKILEELFYQMMLYNFGRFDCYSLKTPLDVKELALIGLDLPETGWTEEDGTKTELAQRIKAILSDKGPMLEEYFGLEIDSNGLLKSLPLLLDQYLPDPACYPLYVIRLATEVDWKSEKDCFETFARETAKFYSNISEQPNEYGKDWKYIVEHVVYPSVKEYFLPPKAFAENGSVLEIANLPNLYKVFERC